MTALLVFLAGTTLGATLAAIVSTDRARTRDLNAHLAEVKADVYRESGERLYDQLRALDEQYTPELNKWRDISQRYRAIVLARHGRTP